MNRPIIIGFGNTLRGDDGAGVYVAQRVAAEMNDIDVVLVQELTPELSAALSGRELAVFVDASTRTCRPAVREVEPADDALRCPDHALHPGDVVSLCRELFAPAPLTTLVMEVPAFNCEFREGLTPESERMADLCVDVIRELLAGSSSAELSPAAWLSP